VHVAARIGAAAGRDEILATDTVWAGQPVERVRVSEQRTLALRGVRKPVVVRAIDWQ
jgi:class 3 adenylate cyclase